MHVIPQKFSANRDASTIKAANAMNDKVQAESSIRPTPAAIVMILAPLTILLWSFYPTISEYVRKWSHDPQYSHGFMVPAFSAALLWMRREQLDVARLKPSWWGLPVLLAGLGLWLAGSSYYFVWVEAVSLIPVIFGLVLLLGGWHAVQWSWPAIAFLAFMIPLPYRVEESMRGPLRRIGTIISTYIMQTLGLPAVAEGNVIVLSNDIRIGVAEACSGLRMLMIFFALSTAVAILSERVMWERILIVLSAVPIALISNITRITVTGVLHLTVSSHVANIVFHDLAGWLMMPFALVLLWFETWLLSNLFIEEVEDDRVRLGLGAKA